MRECMYKTDPRKLDNWVTKKKSRSFEPKVGKIKEIILLVGGVWCLVLCYAVLSVYSGGNFAQKIKVVSVKRKVLLHI